MAGSRCAVANTLDVKYAPDIAPHINEVFEEQAMTPAAKTRFLHVANGHRSLVGRRAFAGSQHDLAMGRFEPTRSSRLTLVLKERHAGFSFGR